MDIRKRVLMFYGIGLLSILATIPLSLLYSTIMQMAAVGIAIFIGAILLFSFGSAYTRTITDLYRKDEKWGIYKYAGTVNPSSFGIVAGIISLLVVAISFAGIVDWEYLGLTMPNIFTIFWGVTGICSLIGGIMARPLAKRKSKPLAERTDL